MRYLSTRGDSDSSSKKSFSEILLGGLAPDGGLYLPDVYPQISRAELDAWRGLSYADLAFAVLSKFVDDIPATDLKKLVDKTYTAEVYCNGRDPGRASEITPVRWLEPGFGLLELSKGVLLTGTVSLPPQRPSPRTDGRFGPSAQKFDGQRVKVTVTVDLSVVDGELVIVATGFYTGPQEHADGHVPAEFTTAVLARFSGRVPYPTLPWAVVATKANSAGSDILISGEARTLTVRPDQF